MRRILAPAIAAAALSLTAVVPASAGPLFRLARTARPAGSAPAAAATQSCRHLIARPADLRLASPVAVGDACPGVRPGSVLRMAEGQCTFNFMFLGSDNRRYMGTAGHCALEGTGITEKAWPPGTGPVAKDVAGRRVGEFAYAILKDPSDIALVRLDPGVAASPQMCHFGGPTRLNDDRSPSLTQLHHFGQGVGVGTLLPARTELAGDLSDPARVTSLGLALPGDSGSPVTTPDGGAVGVLVATGVAAGVSGTGLPLVGNITITRFAPQLVEATKVTGVRYTLQTAPLL